MRWIWTVALAFAVTMIGFGPMGCGTPKKTAPGGGDGKEEQFTLSVPTGTTEITQGDKKDVKVSITRGKEFKQKVTLMLMPGKGLTVSPHEKELSGSETEATFTLTADKTAAAGDVEVEVTATPEKGKAAEQKIAVKVKAAAGPPKKPIDNGKNDKDNKFDIDVPSAAQEITQGDKKVVKISITRGKAFTKKITVALKAGKGLTAEPKQKELTNEKELTVTIMADSKAAPGDAEVTVTATPEEGTAINRKIAVKIKKKE